MIDSFLIRTEKMVFFFLMNGKKKRENQGKNYVYFIQPYEIFRLVIVNSVPLITVHKSLFYNVHCFCVVDELIF